jgi:hypothetical protein
MRLPIVLFALFAILAVVTPAAAESAAPTNTVAGEVPPKPPLKLTDEQKQRVVQAVSGQDALDKLPDGFAAAIGATVPVQKLPERPLPRPLVYEIPALQNYYYVQAADQVLIVDPMTKTVAEIVKL